MMAMSKSDASAKAANEKITREGENNPRRSPAAKAALDPHSGTETGNHSEGGGRNAASRGHKLD